MYVPAHFAMDDAEVQALLEHHGAADLITVTGQGLLATMLPFVFDRAIGPHGALLGHVARNNDQWKVPAQGDSLVIVRGADAYISPGWYESKREHGRVVPTWNYITAHVYGRLAIHDDPAWVEDLVRRLTAKHEAFRAEPWSVDDAPETFVAGQLRALVGAGREISRIETKAKLSQNRPEADVAGVIAGLAARGEEEAARDVEEANRERLPR